MCSNKYIISSYTVQKSGTLQTIARSIYDRGCSVLLGMKLNNEWIMNADENVDETGDSDVSVPCISSAGQGCM